jgi:GT2 family glycosyltransferase
MTPKVTVLLAVKDGEPYVQEALRSVIDQTFADFELLVVDDASTDATVRVVEALRDPRVRLLRNKRNLGQVPSLNLGLREARGEYVARLDADDVCHATRLARQVEVLDSEPRVGLVGTWMEAIGEHGQHLGWLRKTLADYVDFVYHTLIMRVYVSHPSAMYRREPVLALGGYDEATGPAEDKDLWRKLVLERFEARIVPEALVRYRLHDSQLSQTLAAYQRHVDAASQDRFLAQLAPDAPATAVRQLLAREPNAWEYKPHAALRGVALVLAGARTRLALDAEEAQRLEERVMLRLLEVAASRPWHASARVVAAHALARVPPQRRAAARRQWLMSLATAPIRTGTHSATRFLGERTASTPGLGALRGRAKRSRLARRIYGKLVGSE